eukprot:Blabericola_migrator_1__4843@NODE_253_length_10837_cov_194_601764_g211_i1_p5_GENE_NODE_253_length_10837_cov_194_601764_g211_i1NODE_253_length_10837_cov_194_601764_g211_i1_p5_ORF_typecomplete_len464_score99_04SIR2/PF02146_17/0_031SIR2/PF02146_17/5_5e20TPP_enzyme_M/PF00205_22/0_006_NODE_253_length_10837_cov_194_601764_g211_i154256816
MNEQTQTSTALLSKIIFESSAKVVFITGAGISVKSGIPLYRSDREKSKHEGKVASLRRPDEDERSTQVPNSAPRSSREDVSTPVQKMDSPEVYVSISDDEEHGDAKPYQRRESALSSVDDDASSTTSSVPNLAIWDAKLEALCQKSTFLAHPRNWFKYFWFDTHHVEKFLSAIPNEAHFAVGLLCEKFPNRIKCITQNVDGLHQKGGCPQENLVEVHGRIGVYRCCIDICPNGKRNAVMPEAMSFMTSEEERRWYDRTQLLKAKVNKLFETEAKKGPAGHISFPVNEHFPLPCCTLCRAPLIPMTLLFDEVYQTHDFFKFDRANQWLEEADVIVFAGTSFSVYFTEHAIRAAYRGRKRVFNINISRIESAFTDFSDPYAPKKEALLSDPRFNWDSGSEDEPPSIPDDDTSDGFLTHYKPTIYHIVAPADVALMSILPPACQQESVKKHEQARLDRWRSLWSAR